MVGPQLDVPWATSAQAKSIAVPSLDMHRAESSRQHEKFSDVVNWLKSNSTKSESLLEHGSHAAQKKLVTENKDITNVPFPEKTLNAPTSASIPIFSTSSYTSSWTTATTSNSQFSFSSVPTSNNQFSFSSAPPSNNQSPFSFGGQSSAPVKPAASNDADGDDEIEQPSSPSVKKTEEAGVLVVHEVKCKLYVKSTDPKDKDAWKDRGTGQLSIKCKEGVTKGTKDSKPTILVRNDDDNGSENSKVVARMFLIRTKSEEDRDKLAAAIQEYAPVA
ncbi:hypothetical protein M8C21_005705 [Ambrosia artemisiifolia]|uniref:RanBD1 domain-containing protein n=1 Tax=Ambrosia artemisiifolia TaxID=4212 RepID=A0AAD5D8C5_AMBAR|nr:hypothetical protein M8C21_005705 [Ambrosia artemisiifolia]